MNMPEQNSHASGLQQLQAWLAANRQPPIGETLAPPVPMLVSAEAPADASFGLGSAAPVHSDLTYFQKTHLYGV